MANLRSVLYAWRETEAAKKGVELFRVIPNSAIDEIVRALPKTKEELTGIKGIKDAKFQQYGLAILALVKEHGGGIETTAPEVNVSANAVEMLQGAKEERTIFSVSTYLDVINRELWRLRAMIKGEVTSFKMQGNAVYFSLRDSADGSMLSIFMWMNDFSLAGITLAEGLEVIVSGKSEIYKPSGRFNFRADTIELVGEGAFKKAYDALKKQLSDEGLFAPERKRPLPEHPVKIGLITSRTGAVIHDFLTNLGRFGYQITFVDSRVEGATAVKDILGALNHLKAQEVDVLVLIRGGGSLESLQAFNNEHVVRALALFPAVTIVAIGHDKDVPLAQLVADYAPSTPTATTVLLNASWEKTLHELALLARGIVTQYDQLLWSAKDTLRSESALLEERLEALIRPFRVMMGGFNELVGILSRELNAKREALERMVKELSYHYALNLKGAHEALVIAQKTMAINDPLRQLRLGFSIITHNGKVLRKIGDIAVGEDFEARLADGTLVGELTEKYSNNTKN